jgi:hypothetical protein
MDRSCLVPAVLNAKYGSKVIAPRQFCKEKRRDSRLRLSFPVLAQLSHPYAIASPTALDKFGAVVARWRKRGQKPFLFRIFSFIFLGRPTARKALSMFSRRAVCWVHSMMEKAYDPFSSTSMMEKAYDPFSSPGEVRGPEIDRR